MESAQPSGPDSELPISRRLFGCECRRGVRDRHDVVERDGVPRAAAPPSAHPEVSRRCLRPTRADLEALDCLLMPLTEAVFGV